MDTAQRPRSRNSRLSAYYHLANSKVENKSETVTGDRARRGGPCSPDQDAESILGNTSVFQVLRSCVTLKSRHEDLYYSLNEDIMQSYTHLGTIANASSKLESIGGTLKSLSGKEAVSACEARARDARQANERLHESRQKVNELESARRVGLLFAAATRLGAEMPPQYNDVVELCLDPVSAKNRFFSTALRFAALVPVFDCLQHHDEELYAEFTRTRLSVETVRQDLENRMRRGDDAIGSLSLSECARVRHLLGDSKENLLREFLQCATSRIASLLMSPGRDATGNMPTFQQAQLQVSHAVRAVVPLLVSTVNDYAEMGDIDCAVHDVQTVKGPNERPEEAQFLFTWLADRVKDDIVGPVSRLLSADSIERPALNAETELETGGNPFQDLGDEADSRQYSDAVDRFEARCNEMAVGETCAKVVGIGNLFEAAVVRLRTVAARAVLQRVQQRLRKLLQTALRADSLSDRAGFNGLDLSTLSDSVKSLQVQSGAITDGLGCERVNIEGVLLHELSSYAARLDGTAQETRNDGSTCTSGEDSQGTVEACGILRAAVVAEEIGRSLNLDVRSLHARLLHVFTLKVASDVVQLLRRQCRIQGTRPRSSARDVDEVAHRISPEIVQVCNILSSVRSEASWTLGASKHMEIVYGAEDDLLAYGGIVPRIARAWISLLRDETLDGAESVHSVQLDAAAVEQAAEAPGAFLEVAQTAADRCNEAVTLLDVSEIRGRLEAAGQKA